MTWGDMTTLVLCSVLGWLGARAARRKREAVHGELRLNDSPTVAIGDAGSQEAHWSAGVNLNLDTETYDALIWGSAESGGTVAVAGSHDIRGSDMDKTAAAQLDNIRQGAQNLILTVRHRINETLTALEEGEFVNALQRIDEARATLVQLSHAQAYLGVAHAARIIRARELETGMRLSQIGEITEIESVACGHENCPGHFRVKIADSDPLSLEGDTTLYVEVAAE